jgi:hypothetical protein
MPLVRVYEPSFVRQVTLEHLEKWPHVCPSCNKIKWEAYHELNQAGFLGGITVVQVTCTVCYYVKTFAWHLILRDWETQRALATQATAHASEAHV